MSVFSSPCFEMIPWFPVRDTKQFATIDWSVAIRAIPSASVSSTTHDWTRLRRLTGPEGLERILIPAPFVRTTRRSRTVTFSSSWLAAAASTRMPAPDAL